MKLYRHFLYFTLVLIASVCVWPVAAQTPEQAVYYSLSEVIRLAQERSPDAMIARHRFKRSYWEYRSFKAGYLPNLSVEATLPNFNRTIEAITQDDGSETYVERTLARYSANVSLTQKIGLTGGTVFLQSGLQRLDNFFSDTSTHQFLSSPVTIGFRQPIFGYNEYKWDKKIEPLRYEEARRQYLETNEQVASTAISHFFNLLMAQVEKGIALKNMANYDTLYNIAKGRFILGKIAENELLQLELNLLRAEASVETANLNYENMLFTFKSYLRLKANEKIELIPPVQNDFYSINVEEALSEARTNTSSGLNFDRQILEAESNLNMSRMQGRFDAEINASFGLTQTSDKINKAYLNPLDEERISVGITIPILDWGQAKGRIKMAESNLELVRTSVEQSRMDFEQNIFLKVMQFNMQKNQLKIAAKADTVAQKRFDVTQKRYMIGKVNDVLELNNAQIDNDNARMGYYSALKTYWNSYFEMRRLTLFDFRDKRKISVNPESVL
ncbi:MAG TPA: TolC family protein [Bacteroidales bacterium]|nr:TolC family protein [Bacteroidales bacterium]HQQ11862.1 TolC family protein [Bacteroidales bacterium]